MSRPDQPLGQITRDATGVSLRYERQFSHPPERVWRALTSSDDLRHWMPCDIVGPREAGAEVMVPFWEDVVEKFAIEEPVLTGRIVTWDPHRCFAWEWDDELITYELAAAGAGTRLTLVVRLGSKGPGADQVGAGYHMCLDHLIALVDDERPRRLIDADPSALEVLYRPMAAEADA